MKILIAVILSVLPLTAFAEIGKTEFLNIMEVSNSVLETYPKDKFVYVGVGRNPTPVMAYLSTQPGTAVLNLPLTGLESTFPGINPDFQELSPEESGTLEAHLKYFLGRPLEHLSKDNRLFLQPNQSILRAQMAESLNRGFLPEKVDCSENSSQSSHAPCERGRTHILLIDFVSDGNELASSVYWVERFLKLSGLEFQVSAFGIGNRKAHTRIDLMKHLHEFKVMGGHVLKFDPSYPLNDLRQNDPMMVKMAFAGYQDVAQYQRGINSGCSTPFPEPRNEYQLLRTTLSTIQNPLFSIDSLDDYWMDAFSAVHEWQDPKKVELLPPCEFKTILETIKKIKAFPRTSRPDFWIVSHVNHEVRVLAKILRAKLPLIPTPKARL